jgi:hypothetical protein
MYDEHKHGACDPGRCANLHACREELVKAIETCLLLLSLHAAGSLLVRAPDHPATLRIPRVAVSTAAAWMARGPAAPRWKARGAWRLLLRQLLLQWWLLLLLPTLLLLLLLLLLLRRHLPALQWLHAMRVLQTWGLPVCCLLSMWWLLLVLLLLLTGGTAGLQAAACLCIICCGRGGHPAMRKLCHTVWVPLLEARVGSGPLRWLGRGLSLPLSLRQRLLLQSCQLIQSGQVLQAQQRHRRIDRSKGGHAAFAMTLGDVPSHRRPCCPPFRPRRAGLRDLAASHLHWPWTGSVQHEACGDDLFSELS